MASVPKYGGGMADSADGFSAVVESFNQGNGVGIFGQVPERAMAAGIEDGIKRLGIHLGQGPGVGQGGFGIVILIEAIGGSGLCLR